MSTSPSHESVPALAPEVRDAVASSRKLFIASLGELRPRLHRFCARMCGSSLDGEDVVQETLADAFYNLPTLKDQSRIEAWLFRIAYHKCIDFLRRNAREAGNRPLDEEGEESPDVDDAVDESWNTDHSVIDDAIGALVSKLPPKERAALVLKEVFGYSLYEVAEIADTTLAGAKAALHRGREKLRQGAGSGEPARFDEAQRHLFQAYADCFNRRDWDALQRLVRADARLEIVGEAAGVMSGLGATYSGNYTSLKWEWRLRVASIDGALALVHWRRVGDEWRPHAAIRLWTQGDLVSRIRDYIHVEYLLRFARVDSLD